MASIQAGIVGVTGFVGEYILQYLYAHPDASPVVLTSDHAAGRTLHETVPALCGWPDQTLSRTDAKALSQCHVVFVAKKGPMAMTLVPKLLDAGCKVVDIGGSFRFPDASMYEAAYKDKHLCPDLAKEAVYGLPEINRHSIAKARLVANPGCYPTSVILGLAPLAEAGLIPTDGVVADCFSGLSGAGRTHQKGPSNLFVDIQENTRAYKVFDHQHQPEMETHLSNLSPSPCRIDFIPHLLPARVGIYATLIVTLEKKTSFTEVRDLYQDRYASEPFVKVLDAIEDVCTADVNGSNRCHLSLRMARCGQRLVVASALDNLIKGAAGQAIQNMNIMFSLDETAGLSG